MDELAAVKNVVSKLHLFVNRLSVETIYYKKTHGNLNPWADLLLAALHVNFELNLSTFRNIKCHMSLCRSFLLYLDLRFMIWGFSTEQASSGPWAHYGIPVEATGNHSSGYRGFAQKWFESGFRWRGYLCFRVETPKRSYEVWEACTIFTGGCICYIFAIFLCFWIVSHLSWMSHGIYYTAYIFWETI